MLLQTQRKSGSNALFQQDLKIGGVSESRHV
eukprot:COSAG01_NODE_44252_length_421_cov_0.465839_1_plen_30_part_01